MWTLGDWKGANPWRNLTTGWSERGSHLRWAKEGVDDWDKTASFDTGASPRRSTSSLGTAIMRLGYFQEFRGSDMVLLSCGSAEIRALRASLSREFSRGSAVAIHELAKVSDRHPARLFVCPRVASVQSMAGDFVWHLSPHDYSDLDAKLEALESVPTGHQYFELPGTQSELMVSVGEYSDDWWQRDA
jgi:hypothetical protein